MLDNNFEKLNSLSDEELVALSKEGSDLANKILIR